jgi:hypothetical protein
MARLAFNNTCDRYFGPGTPTPLVFRGTAPCRLVVESFDPITSEPGLDRVAYVTVDGFEPDPPDGSLVGSIVTLDMSTADYLAIPSGGPVNFRVIWVEVVNYLGNPQYYRAHVAAV